jgi:hypothetical protein
MMYNFASCETGLLKPDIEAFANMMRIHGIKIKGIKELRVKLNNLSGGKYP